MAKVELDERELIALLDLLQVERQKPAGTAFGTSAARAWYDYMRTLGPLEAKLQAAKDEFEEVKEK